MIQLDKAELFVEELLQSRLSPELTYHNYAHTQDVTHAAMQLAHEEGISDPNDLVILKTAALFHDTGFVSAYEGHEMESCRIVSETLPSFGYSAEMIRAICELIMVTKLPSTPKTHLQKILCDADLDYLGREDFHTLGFNLFTELVGRGIVGNLEEWDRLQLKFLEAHHYYTSSAIAKRQKKKQAYINDLRTG
jgi:predicted metal-dependent HD superfamily phosphohydrolase